MASWLVNLRQPFYGRTVSLGHCSQMRCEDFIPESLVCSMISLYAQSLFTVRMSHHERGTASVKVLGINCALVQEFRGSSPAVVLQTASYSYRPAAPSGRLVQD